MNELTSVETQRDLPDEITRAIHGLRGRLRRTGDDPLRLEFLEDDLREGERTVGEVQAFLDDVVALLSRPGARAADLVDLADDNTVLDRLDYLNVVVNNLRRRLSQLAARSARPQKG